MRDDFQLGFGLGLVKAPIFNIEWDIECESDEIKDFVKEEMKLVWRDLMRSALSGIEFGFSPHEIIWKIENARVRFDKIKPLEPEYSELKTDVYGKYIGLVYRGKVNIPAIKTFVFTHDREYLSLYGRSRLRRAKNPWNWCKNLYELMHRYFERRAEPPIVGYAPSEKMADPDTGTEDDGVKIMLDLLSRMKAGASIALPHDPDEKGEQRWRVDLLQDDRRGDMFLEVINHHETSKLRAVIVPERVATQGEAGTYAMAQAHARMFLTLEDQLLEDLLEQTTRYVVKRLTFYNYGPDAPAAKITSPGLRAEDRENLYNFVTQLLTQPITADAIAGAIDTDAVIQGAGLPMRSGKRTTTQPAPTGTPGETPSKEPGAPVPVVKALAFAKPKLPDPRDLVRALALADAIKIYEEMKQDLLKHPFDPSESG